MTSYEMTTHAGSPFYGRGALKQTPPIVHVNNEASVAAREAENSSNSVVRTQSITQYAEWTTQSHVTRRVFWPQWRACLPRETACRYHPHKLKPLPRYGHQDKTVLYMDPGPALSAQSPDSLLVTGCCWRCKRMDASCHRFQRKRPIAAPSLKVRRESAVKTSSS